MLQQRNDKQHRNADSLRFEDKTSDGAGRGMPTVRTERHTDEILMAYKKADVQVWIDEPGKKVEPEGIINDVDVSAILWYENRAVTK